MTIRKIKIPTRKTRNWKKFSTHSPALIKAVVREVIPNWRLTVSFPGFWKLRKVVLKNRPNKLLKQSQRQAVLQLIKGTIRHVKPYGRVEQNTTLGKAGMNDGSVIINIFVSFRIRADKYMSTESKTTILYILNVTFLLSLPILFFVLFFFHSCMERSLLNMTPVHEYEDLNTSPV